MLGGMEQKNFAGKTLLLLDGNAIVHRAFHALPPLTTKDGVLVNAVYGFSATLLSVLEKFHPEYVAASFDLKAPTFRHKAYAEYKATRTKAPDELYAQIPIVKEVVGAFGIPVYEAEGFEADDVVGTLARRAEEKGMKVVIVTGDMDTLQLVTDNVSVFTMRKGINDTVVYDVSGVRNKYGFSPEQLPDFKGLRGDPSDNIPGVKGIGEKTATDLLKQFETLEGVYEHLSEIKGATREKLERDKMMAIESKMLGTIRVDVPVAVDFEACRLEEKSRENVVAIFQRLNFFSLIKRIPGASPHNQVTKKEKKVRDKKYEKISGAEIARCLEEIRAAKSFAFALDWEGNAPYVGILKGIAVSLRPGRARYVPMRKNPFVSEAEHLNLAEAPTPPSRPVVRVTTGQAGLNPSLPPLCLEDSTSPSHPSVSKTRHLPPTPLSRRLDISPQAGEKGRGEGQGRRAGEKENKVVLKNIFSDPSIQKIGYNVKEAMEVLDAEEISYETKNISNVLLLAYLLQESSDLSLERLALIGLGEEISFSGTQETLFENLNTQDLSPREEKLCEKADSIGKLHKIFVSKILQASASQEKGKTLRDVYETIEMPLVPVLAKMEERGVQFDSVVFAGISETIDAKIARLEKKIHELAGVEFNVNSTKQLREVLFDRLKIATGAIKKTKTGFSTASSELQKIKGEYEIAAKIESYRELFKLKTTYVDVLPKLADKNGRLHTTFNQAVAATGRLSSSDPNLQNIPTRTPLGRLLRNAFVAAPGYKLLSADYSQIDLRCAAHLSGDKKMIEAFYRGDDIHTITASEVFGVARSEVTKAQRRQAKVLNFGVLYGMGTFGFMNAAGVSRDEAQAFIDAYREKFKGLAQYLQATKESAKEKGYVETEFGRRRYVPEINSPNFQVAASGERMAINLPIQGLTADIMKLAMISAEKLAEEYSLPLPLPEGEMSVRGQRGWEPLPEGEMSVRGQRGWEPLPEGEMSVRGQRGWETLPEKGSISLQGRRGAILKEGNDNRVRMLLQIHDELIFEVEEGLEKEFGDRIKETMEKIVTLRVPLVVDVAVGESWGEL